MAGGLPLGHLVAEATYLAKPRFADSVQCPAFSGQLAVVSRKTGERQRLVRLFHHGQKALVSKPKALASGGPILFGRVGPLARGLIAGDIRNRGVGFRGLLLFARSAGGFFRHGLG